MQALGAFSLTVKQRPVHAQIYGRPENRCDLIDLDSTDAKFFLPARYQWRKRQPTPLDRKKTAVKSHTLHPHEAGERLAEQCCRVHDG